MDDIGGTLEEEKEEDSRLKDQEASVLDKISEKKMMFADMNRQFLDGQKVRTSSPERSSRMLKFTSVSKKNERKWKSFHQP